MTEHIDQRFSDATLADELTVAQPPLQIQPCVLVTGATGFLGLRVVQSLLECTEDSLICLVRADTADKARQRLFSALSKLSVNTETLMARVSVIAGSVDKPHFDLDNATYESLTWRVGRIVHCAAEVNWVKTYSQLRPSNVIGTLEVIRFACAGVAKPLCAVSSIATCYADCGKVQIDESTCTLPWIDSMPLYYAQSKCVAEHLLRRIAECGLPVVILRPSLLAGDTRSGESSNDDLTAALLHSAVRSGLASNADWLLDHVPVDYLAQLIARLPVSDFGANLRVLHVVNPQPRSWRELVLWLKLYGYNINLVDTDDWLESIFDSRDVAGEVLYKYRRLFTKRKNGSFISRGFQMYLEEAQRSIDSSHSHQYLNTLGVPLTPIDPPLLHRYLEWFSTIELLPSPEKQQNLPQGSINSNDLLSERIVRAALDLDPTNKLRIKPRSFDSSEGLLSALAGATTKGTGLTAWQFKLDGSVKKEIVAKTRGYEKTLVEAICVAASEQNVRLGQLFERHHELLEVTGKPARESSLYKISKPCLSRHVPRVYGDTFDLQTGLHTLLLERLPDKAFASSFDLGKAWDDLSLSKAIETLACIQSTPRPYLEPLLQEKLLSPLPSTCEMVNASELWHAQAKLVEQRRGNEYLNARRFQWIESLQNWWPNYSARMTTLVHNDCNPRNFAIYFDGKSHQTKLVDWELATIGVPQRDLAELLCFVSDIDKLTFDHLSAIIVKHGERLHQFMDKPLDLEKWLEGFELALRHFVVTRLPMYTLVDCYRALPWLAAVESKAASIATILNEHSIEQKLTVE